LVFLSLSHYFEGKIKGGEKKMGRRKFKVNSGNEIEEKNKRTVKSALQEMGEKLTAINIISSYNACIGTLGKYRQWTRKEVINYLKNHWFEDTDKFLEDLEMQGKFRR